MQVNITSDGKLQLTDDRMIYQPLSVEAVELLANSIPSAENAAVQIPVLTAIQRAADVIGRTYGGTYASMNVQNSLVSVTCDNVIFLALQNEFLGSVNQSITSFVYGPLTATQTGA